MVPQMRDWFEPRMYGGSKQNPIRPAILRGESGFFVDPIG